MKKLWTALAGISLIFFVSSCEQCSDCTIAEYEGTCDCTGFFGDGSVTTDTYLENEIEGAEFNCSFSFCTWSATQTGTMEDEICGKKKDVEDETGDLERDGWNCASPSR